MNNQSHGTLVTLALVILGIVFLLPGACGALFYSIALSDWIQSGLVRANPDFVTIAAPSLLASILLLGLLLRFSRWSHAPLISLWLSILAVFIVLTACVMLLPYYKDPFTSSPVWLFATSLLALLICAVPPYLHWRSNR